jgi:hypothetical protein
MGGKDRKMGEIRNSYKILVRKFQGKRTPGSPRWGHNEVVKKWSVRTWTEFMCLWTQSSGDSCEHGNAHLGAIKVLTCLDYVRDYQLLKADSAPQS